MKFIRYRILKLQKTDLKHYDLFQDKVQHDLKFDRKIFFGIPNLILPRNFGVKQLTLFSKLARFVNMVENFNSNGTWHLTNIMIIFTQTCVYETWHFTGWTQDRGFNSRIGCMHITHFCWYEVKRSNLELKTWSKHLLGYLPVDIVHPRLEAPRHSS